MVAGEIGRVGDGRRGAGRVVHRPGLAAVLAQIELVAVVTGTGHDVAAAGEIGGDGDGAEPGGWPVGAVQPMPVFAAVGGLVNAAASGGEANPVAGEVGGEGVTVYGRAVVRDSRCCPV